MKLWSDRFHEGQVTVSIVADTEAMEPSLVTSLVSRCLMMSMAMPEEEDGKRRCIAIGCETRIHTNLLMCYRHWEQVKGEDKQTLRNLRAEHGLESKAFAEGAATILVALAAHERDVEERRASYHAKAAVRYRTKKRKEPGSE
jgi:hypothetical protein